MPVSSEEKKALGVFGEDAACAYLKRHGFRIIQRNFSCRMGEIDIIAADRRWLVFAEVKLRKNADFGTAAEFVTPAKQRRVIMAAQLWLVQHKTALQPRFDVIEVYAPQGLSTVKPKINLIEDAYQL